jgi:hypothetical protein
LRRDGARRRAARRLRPQVAGHTSSNRDPHDADLAGPCSNPAYHLGAGTDRPGASSNHPDDNGTSAHPTGPEAGSDASCCAKADVSPPDRANVAGPDTAANLARVDTVNGSGSQDIFGGTPVGSFGCNFRDGRVGSRGFDNRRRCGRKLGIAE